MLLKIEFEKGQEKAPGGGWTNIEGLRRDLKGGLRRGTSQGRLEGGLEKGLQGGLRRDFKGVGGRLEPRLNLDSY